MSVVPALALLLVLVREESGDLASKYLYFQEVLRWTVNLFERLLTRVWDGLHLESFLGFRSCNCRT